MEITDKMHPTSNLERKYLQTVLSWLDARLEQDIRRWQLAGQDPADRFRGLYISDSEALSLAQRGAGTNWGSTVSLPDDEDAHLSQVLDEILAQIDDIEARADERGVELRLKSIQQIFELNDFEWWAFIVAIAPALDLRYERIYAYLQDDVTRTTPSIDLILNILAPNKGLARLDYLSHFDRYAALQSYRLLQPVAEANDKHSGLRQSFKAAQGVVDWLLGAYSPSAALGEWAVLVPAPEEEQRQQAAEIFEHANMPSENILEGVHPFLSLHGPDFLQQEIATRQLAEALGKPLLKLKLLPDEAAENALQKLHQAVRDTRMLQALLYIQGCDIFIDKDGCLFPDVYDVMRLTGDTVVFSSRIPFKFSAEMPGNDYPLMNISFEMLSASDRAGLWQMMIEGASGSVTEEELNILAGQFTLTTGQVIAASSTAMSQALQENRQLAAGDLFLAARFHSGHHLAELAHKIEPRYAWDDLVLPETPMSMLHEMVNMVQSRAMVLEQWGLGRKLTAGAGISALFSGPPGTGKTLAAQIMANQLGIDLYRIDLSTVISKYIGETEKNLERIFTEAAQSNAILFFDEADTIFGKRSEVKDAHDRYANIEVGYLLQRMESYDGISILATNLRANLDDAFTRRLQFIINFPFPDEEYRLKIWEVLIPPGMPRADDLDLRIMAHRFKIAGGSIRNVIVTAAFQAASNGGKVTMDHLMHGARREFQKMGKLLHEADFSV